MKWKGNQMNEILKPWYAIATPHEDICKGRLEEAVFAANIWAVVQGTAPEVYLDPEEFFRKTYMTGGLESVLVRIGKALSGDAESGDRIISLQTAFGGGKTHTLVALWHLAKHANRLKKSSNKNLMRFLGKNFPDEIKAVAVFTNASCDATQGRRSIEGVHTHTLWGELALQLGGKKLYEKIRANDENRRVPQGLFVDILKEATPCLILLDELADYCVGAAAVPVGNTTLADQTVSFIQQLEEAVSQVPGSAVVATLPASKYEVAQSEKGQEVFMTLEKRFQRLGADVKPVADEEIYEVIRARLFESIAPKNDPDYPKKVARVYQEMYAAHSGEITLEAAKSAYREQIERAYPFHPLVIDALYTRWGSHPDFQRTRGVLRLLASIVGELWKRRAGATQTQHLIQPCHVRWSIDAMQAALTRLWGPGYQAVVAADVLGAKSNAAIFDEERAGDYAREEIGQGIAAGILLGSFGGKAERSGFSAREIKLGSSKHGVNWSYTDGALLELENRCFYLHSTGSGAQGKRYWFSTKPNLNKLIVQYRQQMAGRSFDEDILESIRSQLEKSGSGGATWRIIVDPAEDLPEQKSLTLLILKPSLMWNGNGDDKGLVSDQVLKISGKCGGKDRLFRNTLVFLAGTSRGMNKLRQARREIAALEGVKSDYWSQLDDEQQKELNKRLDAAARGVIEALGPAYTVALRVSREGVETCSLGDARHSFQEHLGFLWTTLVEDEEWILRKVGTVSLTNTGLIIKDGALRVKDAVDAFLRFTDKPMISLKEAVTAGLEQACLDGLIGIGRGGSPSTLQARYCRQCVLIDPLEDGVWIIPAFEQEVDKKGAVGGEKSPGTEDRPDQGVAAPRGGEISRPGKVEKRVRRFKIAGAVPVESYGELFRCFVGPAVRMNLKKLHLGVQFEMEAQSGNDFDPDDPAFKAMKEAARQLGLKFEAEE
jgi:hypothetical protein